MEWFFLAKLCIQQSSFRKRRTTDYWKKWLSRSNHASSKQAARRQLQLGQSWRLNCKKLWAPKRKGKRVNYQLRARTRVSWLINKTQTKKVTGLRILKICMSNPLWCDSLVCHLRWKTKFLVWKDDNDLNFILILNLYQKFIIKRKPWLNSTFSGQILSQGKS